MKRISTGSPFEATMGYSRAIVKGGWCFVSGVTGYDYATMTMPDDIADQARNCFGTIGRVLAEAGFTMDDIVRVQYTVADAALVDALIPALGDAMGKIRPAATMVIAPECGGTLVSLLQQLQAGHWQSVPNLNVSWTLAEIFSDKFRTYQWLSRYGVPTPVTKAISVAEYNELRHSRGCQHLFTDGHSMPVNEGLGILKPRDGVGCDGVSFIQLAGDEFSAAAEKSTAETTSVDTTAIERPWLIQQYVPGVPCSVGLIGRRGPGPATILPPAIQNLRLQNGQPVYCGGKIPCDLDLQNAILPLAEKLASAVGEFSGYLGVDIVVSRASSGELVATVIELNPRLCTSYVGYRRATDSNLAGLILREATETEIHWRAAGTEFEACGQVDFSS